MTDNQQVKKTKKVDMGITLLLVVGIVVVVNFFSFRIFFRWDLTQNNIYSISEATKRILGELDDVVSIKAYFSEDLPYYFLNTRQEVGDILEEYKAYSGGRVRVEFIDPKDDEKIQQELYMIGIPQLTFDIREKDKAELTNGYMGLAISHDNKTEVIPALRRGTIDLEYQLTTAIKKVTVEEIATIGFLASQLTHGIDEELKIMNQEMSQLYNIQRVDLGEENPVIPDNIDTLIIAGPKDRFNELQLMAINSFLARGGSLLALLDGVAIGDGLVASRNSTGLEELFKKYGITVNQDLVADSRNSVASFSQGFMQFRSNYAFWPKITSEGFNQDNSAVSSLENVTLFWASSIDIDNNQLSEGSYSGLMFTTQQAWHMTDNYNVTPTFSNVPQDTQKQFTLGVAVNGPIKNPYPEIGTAGQFNVRIIVVGDSDFITDNLIVNNPDNLTLAQNLVDSLSLDEDLINIRSKGVTSRPIKEDLGEGSKAAMRYFNIFGLTVAVIAFGMIRYFMRRRSRFVDEL